jgi:glucosamine kinase
LDAGTPPGPLVAGVLRELDADRPGRDGQHDRVIQVVNSRPGVQLSALAPLVTAAYRAGDPQAQSIVERAAAALVATLALIRDPAESTPIVLAGSLAGDGSPVGVELRTLLAARFAGAVLPARTGVGGAAWLALAALDPALATRETHTRLTS